ncbi:MAG: hypothetical protein VX471_09200, partial [Acidobacteriota bacterium]|nr:hypothetical protein [Acidobacteriota bacterium]
MRFILVFIMLTLASPAPLLAQTSAEPFKLGTFEIDGGQRVGIVLRDSLIVELDAANRALEGDLSYPMIPMPADMLELIGRYEYGMKVRLYEIVANLVEHN